MRFKEFSGEWEKYELNSIVKRVERKNNNNATDVPLTISSQYGLIDQRKFFNKQIASKDMSNYYLLLNGEFAYNKSYSNGYPVGAIKRLDKYATGAVSTLYICFSLIDKNTYSNFLSYYFDTSKWYSQIFEIANEGARNHGLLNIATRDFFNIKIYKPHIKEQQKIATFLTLINKRIETQMKIIEEYKSLIKGIREKLIYKNKSLNKVIKIKDIADCLGGYAFDSSTYVKRGKYKVITIGNVTGDEYINISNTNFIDTLPNDIHKYQILKKESILISLTGNVGRVSKVLFENCLLNQRVATLMVKKDNLQDYIYYCLSSIIFENSMIKCSQGAAQKNINNTDIESFNIPFTDNINYIVMICNIIKKFDLLLTNNKKILENYFKFKKYLLNNMFI